MLQVLRDSMKYLAWILWVVIAIFVLFVFVDFGSGVNPGTAPTQAAATVGDHQITYREFEREYRQLEEQFRQQLGGQLTPELTEQLRLPMQALNRLVNRKVLRSTFLEPPLPATIGHRLGLGSTPTDASLVDALSARPAPG